MLVVPVVAATNASSEWVARAVPARSAYAGAAVSQSNARVPMPRWESSMSTSKKIAPPARSRARWRAAVAAVWPQAEASSA